MMMKSEFVVHRYRRVEPSTLSTWVHVQAFCPHVTANMEVWVGLLQFSLQCGPQRCRFTHVITPPVSARTCFCACFASTPSPQSVRPNIASVDPYGRAIEKAGLGTAYNCFKRRGSTLSHSDIIYYLISSIFVIIFVNRKLKFHLAVFLLVQFSASFRKNCYTTSTTCGRSFYLPCSTSVV